MNFELHIFTNSTKNAPCTKCIELTYQSFVETFKQYCIPTIWLDSNPNIKKAKEYQINLEKLFTSSSIVNTSSLSDGYINAVKNSNAEFLIMLEHDWKFLPNITHSIEDICEAMKAKDLVHFRFNKRQNKIKMHDKYLKERQFKDLKYCITPSLSNNPHIIQRKMYIEKVMKFLKKSNGSSGIEENISNIGLSGAIYGPIDYPKTVIHLNGRK